MTGPGWTRRSGRRRRQRRENLRLSLLADDGFWDDGWRFVTDLFLENCYWLFSTPGWLSSPSNCVKFEHWNRKAVYLLLRADILIIPWKYPAEFSQCLLLVPLVPHQEIRHCDSRLRESPLSPSSSSALVTFQDHSKITVLDCLLYLPLHFTSQSQKILQLFTHVLSLFHSHFAVRPRLRLLVVTAEINVGPPAVGRSSSFLPSSPLHFIILLFLPLPFLLLSSFSSSSSFLLPLHTHTHTYTKPASSVMDNWSGEIQHPSPCLTPFQSPPSSSCLSSSSSFPLPPSSSPIFLLPSGLVSLLCLLHLPSFLLFSFSPFPRSASSHYPHLYSSFPHPVFVFPCSSSLCSSSLCSSSPPSFLFDADV